MLISLQQNINVRLKWLKSKQHSLHPEEARLEEPDELVDVMTGDLLRVVQQEHSVRVAGEQSPDGTPVLTGTNGKICIAVGPKRGPLHQL